MALTKFMNNIYCTAFVTLLDTIGYNFLKSFWLEGPHHIHYDISSISIYISYDKAAWF